MNEELEHIRKLFATAYRRWQMLEQQAAKFDRANTPTHIVLEIEDLDEQLEEWARWLQAADPHTPIPLLDPSSPFSKRLARRREIAHLLSQLMQHEDSEDWDMVITCGESIRKLDRDHQQARLKMATAYRARSTEYRTKLNLAMAIADLNRAIDLEPENADGYYQRGLCYEQKKDYPRAIVEYDQAIRLKPGNGTFYQQLGICYAHMGRYDWAMKEFNNAILSDASQADFFWQRGMSHHNMLFFQGQGNYDWAIDDFNRAIRIAPRQAKYYYSRGLSYAKKGEHNRAIIDYEQSIRINKNNAAYYYSCGLSYYHEGYFLRAIENYTRAINITARNGEYFFSRGLAHKSIAYRFKKQNKTYKSFIHQLSAARNFRRAMDLKYSEAKFEWNKLDWYWRLFGWIYGTIFRLRN